MDYKTKRVHESPEHGLHTRTLSPNVSHMPATSTADHNGPAIRDFRKIRGMSCAQLAEQAGIHEQTLRNLELYDSVTRPDNPKGCSEVVIERIASALDVRVASILRSPMGAVAEVGSAA